MPEKCNEPVNSTGSSNTPPASDDQNKERFYAVEILTVARSTILRGCEDFLTNRERITRFRESSPQKARDAYNELEKTRKKMLEALASAQQSLWETEEDSLADYAGKLYRGLAAFNLMTRDYTPVNKLLACSKITGIQRRILKNQKEGALNQANSRWLSVNIFNNT